ncbi:hypothetical protein ACH4D5_36075 [Streptomyces sp. NPDC018029]|uniref:hypothetical protein n=1 Tax=Streptomyces sp. NPDC018029 TaxID=3365032 RepID=UPI0037994C1F
MSVAQGILVAIVTALVGVPFMAVLAVWATGDTETGPAGADAERVTLEKGTTDDNSGWDRESTEGCCVILVVILAIVLVEVAVADPGPNNGYVWTVTALSVVMVAAVPVVRYYKGVRGLPLALHVSGALTLAVGCLTLGVFITEPPTYRLGLALLAVVAAGVATTSVLALVLAEVTLTVVPVAVAVLVAVFGAVAQSVHDSAEYAMRYGHPVRMTLPTRCVGNEGMTCGITWNKTEHGPSPAFEYGQEVTVHFSPEGRSRYGRYYALGGFYKPGDANDPTLVSLDTRAIDDNAYVTTGYEADSMTPLGRFRLPWPVWAALPLFLVPLALHLFLVRDRATHPLRRRRARRVD